MAIVDKALPVLAGGRFDDLHDGEPEFAREFEVAGIMAGHSHDGAGAITNEDVIGDPDGNPLTVDRVESVSAGEDAGLFFCQFGPFEI